MSRPPKALHHNPAHKCAVTSPQRSSHTCLTLSPYYILVALHLWSPWRLECHPLPLPPSTQHTTPTRQRKPRRTAKLCPLGEWLPCEPLLLIKPSPERNSSSIFVLVRNVRRADHIINIKLPEIRPLSRQTVLIASSLHS